jgi:hypothetical protein
VNKAFERHFQGYSAHPYGISAIHNNPSRKKRRNKNDAQEQAWMRMRRYRPASLVKVSVVFRWRGLSLLESDLLIHFGLSFSIKEAACNMRGGKHESEKCDIKRD